MGRKQITINDIANETGVSKTTVSRYLNGKFEFMSEQTRASIAEAIARTGYRPNRIANSLKTDRSGLIGLVMSNVMSTQTPRLLGSICDTCAQHGKKVIVVNSENDPDKEQELVRDLLSQRVEGLLVLSGYNGSFYHDLDENELPVVMADRIPENCKLDCVAINHAESTQKVIEHLIDRGFRRIVLLKRTHINPNNTPLLREKAAIRTCQTRLGTDCSYQSVSIRYDADPTEVFQELIEILESAFEEGRKVPTAVFVVEAAIMNLVACSYYRTSLELSNRFTIAGYSEWNMGKLITPQISTIEQPLEKLGQVATEMLLNRIEARELKKNREPTQNSLECRIQLA